MVYCFYDRHLQVLCLFDSAKCLIVDSFDIDSKEMVHMFYLHFYARKVKYVANLYVSIDVTFCKLPLVYI